MRLYIHGLGTAAVGLDAELALPLGRLSELPIALHAPPALRRRFGRVAKLVYVAACRAITDAGVADPGALAIVVGTAVGEAEVSLELLAQIHESQGRTLSPKHVPNSVHNSPAGYLSIGLGNRAPSVTVSQGFLAAEGALMAAGDLLGLGVAERALVIAADEADPEWVDRLRKSGAKDLAEALCAEGFQEGAVALVVGREPGGQQLGTVEAAVLHGPCSKATLDEWLQGTAPSAERELEVAIHDRTTGKRLLHAARTFLQDHSCAALIADQTEATPAGFALWRLAQAIRAKQTKDLLLLAAEVDDVGLLHFTRVVSE